MHVHAVILFPLEDFYHWKLYRTKLHGAGKSLAQPGRKQATATKDFEFHISYL